MTKMVNLKLKKIKFTGQKAQETLRRIIQKISTNHIILKNNHLCKLEFETM